VQEREGNSPSTGPGKRVLTEKEYYRSSLKIPQKEAKRRRVSPGGMQRSLKMPRRREGEKHTKKEGGGKKSLVRADERRVGFILKKK